MILQNLELEELVFLQRFESSDIDQNMVEKYETTEFKVL